MSFQQCRIVASHPCAVCNRTPLITLPTFSRVFFFFCCDLTPCLFCLPTEVIRTRLREEGSKYKYFFQTARLVAVEDGYAAFYRGLIPQLIRQIPNTALVLSTYELIVYLLGQPSK